MKFKKQELDEIIDSNGELIGKSDIPTNGSDLESQANNTTDYNAKIATQPYRYDMLGKLGFSFFPFYEGKEDQSENELMKDLAELAYEQYTEILKYYYKNPNKLKSDYRLMSEKDFNSQPEEKKESNFKCAKKMMDVIEKHYKNAFKETIDESAVVEDKMVEKKSESEISKKEEDREIKKKQIEKIAGLINKLDKQDVDKLINLLERK